MAILTESIILDVIAVFSSIFIALYYYVTRNFGHWEKLGVPYVKPVAFLGNLKDVVLQRTGIGFQLKNIYNQYKGKPYVGIFSFDKPAVLVRDLDMVKNVLVKDSHNFINRIFDMNEDVDPLGARSLFVMKDQSWKHMRSNISPTFTSGKMKKMFHLVERCAKELDQHIDNVMAENEGVVQVKDATSKFTTDVIASCAFGIDSNSFKDPNAEFITQVQAANTISPVRGLAFFLSFFAPNLLKILRLKAATPGFNNFVRETVWNTVAYREKHGIVRNDFLDNMIELRKKGMEVDDKTQQSMFKIDGDDLAAQALAFLTAGSETSSTTMSYTLYELALHPDIQTRLRKEIKEVLAKHDQEVTYESIQEMTYLDMVVSETLRKYPVLPFLDRKCASDYKLPGPSGKGTVTVKAGTAVYIPILAIHYDPEYHPEPDKYDPERFTEENNQNRPNYCYLPFGEGPRFCIGMRFGLMQTKAGLIHILSHHEVEPCKDTPVPLEFDHKSFLMQTKKGISLLFKKAKSQ